MPLFTALLLGLAGSLHCAGMCGPLALALPTGSGTAVSFGAGRLAYNLGRILTYCLLGVVFGLAGKTVAFVGIQRWASLGLGILLLVSLFGSRKLGLSRPVTALVSTLKNRMSGLFKKRSFSALLMLGLLNGLLPCPMVYVAAAGAVAAGGVAAGTLYMALFGLGTVPMMLGISLSGRLMPISWRMHLRKAIPASVILLACLLILRGMALDIPYLSPDLSGGTPSCCHH